MKRNIIFTIIFLIGLSIFSYPIISNLLATKEHHTIISEHNEKILQMSQSEIKDVKDQAAAYNEKLNNLEVPIEDPFAEVKKGEDNSGYLDVLNIGESMGTIEIPKIDVTIPIFHGTDEKVLQRGVGHLSNTSLPVGGEGTHTVLTGHRGLPSAKMFRHLDKIEIGDVFFITSLDETLAYQVDHVAVVLPNEVELLDINADKEFATLITCEPYMINTHRMLVRGERIPYLPDAEKTEKIKAKEGKDTYLIWITGIGILASGVLVYVWHRRKKRNRVEG